MKIEAAILLKSKKIILKKLEIPELKRGQVLVRVIYSGICRSQLMEFEGKRGKDKWLPHLFGHEASGIVKDFGPGVTKVKKGSKVILTWIKSKGLDSAPPEYQLNKKKINAGKITTFSNYTIVSENRLVIKPKNLTFKEAALYGCAFLTGAGLVLNKLRNINRKKIICVYGLGGIGLSALTMLSSLNFKNIVAIDNNINKLDLAKKIGCTLTINSHKNNVKEAITKKFNKLADICVEAGGSANTIEKSFDIISSSKGKLIFSSHPPANQKIKIYPHELISGKTIIGSWGGSSKPDRDVNKIYELIKNKQRFLFFNGTKVYKLSEIKDGFKDLKKGTIFRPLIKIKKKNNFN